MRLAHPTPTAARGCFAAATTSSTATTTLGRLDAGLFFLSFQRSPQQFIDVQTSLATDALNEYIKHVGSAIFAVPGGVAEGEFVGAALFA